MSRGEGVEQQAGCRFLGSSTAAQGELAGVGGVGLGRKGPQPHPRVSPPSPRTLFRHPPGGIVCRGDPPGVGPTRLTPALMNHG